MSDRYVVISADCHAGPPMGDYREFVEPAYRDRFDDYVRIVEEYDAEFVQRAAADGPGAQEEFDERNRVSGLSDSDLRLHDLEADGIVAEVIFPQGAAPFHQHPPLANPRGRMAYVPDDELRGPGVRAYNRWLAQFCGAAPGRRAGVAIVPIRDIPAAVREVRWARDAGLASVSLPVLTDDMVPYNDRAYEPLWSVCEELDLPLNAHGGAGRTYGTGPDSAALICAECDFFTRRALWFLIFSGVFERHPRLRLVFTEQRAHWVKPTLEELDSIYESRLVGVRSWLPLRPSEYFARNCYVGASFMSRAEGEHRHDVGVDRLMWGADYPHVEGTWPFTHESYRMTFAGIPDDDRRAILGGNAAEVYGFDLAKLSAVAERIGPTPAELDEPLAQIPDEAWTSWAFRRVGAWH